MLRRHICWSESQILSFACNFFDYIKFYSDWGRVIGKIKQDELDRRNTAPLSKQLLITFNLAVEELVSVKSANLH